MCVLSANFLQFALRDAQVANYTDAAIVFINAMSGEGYITVDKNEGDRNNLTAWHNGNDLIGNVTSVNNNTIVVVHSVSALTVEPWIDNPNVTAVLWASLPGCESGNSITEVLYGDYNPSGRLPYTIAKQRSDYSAEVLYTNTSVTPQVNYTEGLLVDYRAFDARDIKPRFEFGFGLSYSKFEYSYPRVHWIGDASQERHEGKGDWNHRWGHKQAPEGLPEWLFEPVYEVSFVLKNIGGVDGHEVPQLYLGFDNSTGEPPKVLREFDRVYLAAEEQKKITWNLSSYDLSIWNTTQQRWVRPHGRIELYIGASSRDIRQTLHV